MVGKLIAQMGLKICQLKAHKYKHADEAHKTYENLLNCNFSLAQQYPINFGRVM